jgi:hypothetical protein
MKLQNKIQSDRIDKLAALVRELVEELQSHLCHKENCYVCNPLKNLIAKAERVLKGK